MQADAAGYRRKAHAVDKGVVKDMKEKDLPFDRSRHAIYTKKARACVQRLLNRYYDAETAAALWEKVQLQYCEFLKDEPALGDVRITVSIYDPILIFAWYAVVPDKPPLEDIQQDVFDCFMGGFKALGKLFNLNRGPDNRLANLAFKSASFLGRLVLAFITTSCSIFFRIPTSRFWGKQAWSNQTGT